jgi:hypothetical protein
MLKVAFPVIRMTRHTYLWYLAWIRVLDSSLRHLRVKITIWCVITAACRSEKCARGIIIVLIILLTQTEKYSELK